VQDIQEKYGATPAPAPAPVLAAEAAATHTPAAVRADIGMVDAGCEVDFRPKNQMSAAEHHWFHMFHDTRPGVAPSGLRCHSLYSIGNSFSVLAQPQTLACQLGGSSGMTARTTRPFAVRSYCRLWSSTVLASCVCVKRKSPLTILFQGIWYRFTP
jgi:hypothetical protein